MRKFLWPFDFVLVVIPIIIISLGIITIYTITYSTNSSLAINQIIAAVIGLVLFSLFAFSNFRSLGTAGWIIYGLVVLSLIPLLAPIASKIPFTLKSFGAYRWYNLGFFQLQPSELAKLLLALVIAQYLAFSKGRLSLKSSLIYLSFCLVPIALIAAQPDLGTGIILTLMTAGLFLVAKPPKLLIITIAVIICASIPLVWSNLAPYQKTRVETFINPSIDPLESGYNIRQALIAVGSGRLTGRGFGLGSQTTLNFLPVAHADFIFAGFAEATGFVGCLILLLLYALMLYRITEIALKSQDRFATFFALAILIKLLSEIVINVGMNLSLLPVAGVPLPFMSYGGSALIVNLAAIGILESIYIRTNRTVFD